MVRSAATSTVFSRRVVRAVEQLRERRGLTNTQLIRAAGFSANYFYIRLRGEAPFNTNDIEKLADALEVEPHEVLQLAESPELALDDDADRTERVDGVELARRLRFLTGGPVGPDGRTFSSVELVAFAAERTVVLSVGEWEALLGSVGPVRVATRLLEVFADYFAVDPRYVRSLRDKDVAQLVEAEIELHRALIETGATAVSARALGGMSATQLEAITRAIRSIEIAPRKDDPNA